MVVSSKTWGQEGDLIRLASEYQVAAQLLQQTGTSRFVMVMSEGAGGVVVGSAYESYAHANSNGMQAAATVLMDVDIANGSSNRGHVHVSEVSKPLVHMTTAGLQGFCTTAAGNLCADPLNWGKAAAALAGSHVDEVKEMVRVYYESEEVVIEGVTLTVAQVAAVARRSEVVVSLDAASAKGRVDESSNWVLTKIMNGGDIYGVTTGFGATSHRRTQAGVELQRELIR